MNNRLRPLLPIIGIFIVTGIASIAGRNQLDQWGISSQVVILGNAILYAATFVSFFIAIRGLNRENPHAFIRSVYASIMTKMGICLVAALAYIMSTAEINTPGLFICMGLYLLYTFVEVGILTRLARRSKDA